MITFNTEIKNIRHPYIKSVRLWQSADQTKKQKKVLIIEAAFNFGKTMSKEAEDKLMDLLIDLKKLQRDIERYTGKLDCIDIRPGKAIHGHPAFS
ncbi:MAG: hypothetical protein H6867_11660 [Rhodospirillales bacterium]|nr:hypothetical protein [Rhodospirillales bacterium]